MKLYMTMLVAAVLLSGCADERRAFKEDPLIVGGTAAVFAFVITNLVREFD